MQHDANSTIAFALQGSALIATSWQLDRVEGMDVGLRYGYTIQTRDAAGLAGQLHLFVEELPAADAGKAAEGSRLPLVMPADEDAPNRVQLWLYPNDPALPALPAVTVPAAAEVLLSRLGWPAGVQDLEVVSYRPGKRAVVRILASGITHYLKVVRPSKAEALRSLHTVFGEGELPVPRVLAFSPDGLLLLERAAGEIAADHLESLPGTDFLAQLDQLRVQMAALPLRVPSRPGPLERYSWYCQQLAGLLPAEQARLSALEEAIGREAGTIVPEQTVRHGDLHLEQIMVDPAVPGRIVGLLDIDTAGLGDPAADASGFYAELVRRVVTARIEDRPEAAAAAAALALEAAQSWAEQPGWRYGVAAHLLAHALTPASLAESRPLALELITTAERAVGLNQESSPATAP